MTAQRFLLLPPEFGTLSQPAEPFSGAALYDWLLSAGENVRLRNRSAVDNRRVRFSALRYDFSGLRLRHPVR